MNQTRTTLTRPLRAFVALGAISALTVALALGCSDSNPVTPTKLTGSTADSSFQLVSNQFSPTDIGGDGLEWVDLLLGELPGVAPASPTGGMRPFLARGGAPIVGDTVITVVIDTSSVDGWIVFTATLVSFQDTFNIIDSMRFRDLTNTPFIPRDSLNIDSINGLDIRIHGSVIANDPTDFTGTAQVHSSITADVIGRDAIGNLDTVQFTASETDTLNGTVADSANGQCDVSATLTSTFTNIVGLADDSTSACPLSGQASVTASIDVACTDGVDTATFNDTWTITATFNGGTDVSIVFENSTTRWVTTEPCAGDPPPAASSLRRKVGFAQATIE